MAKVKLQLGKKNVGGGKKGALAPKFELPKAAMLVADNLYEYSFLLYGVGKIGKTSLLTQFPDPYFLMFDPLKRGMEMKQSRIKSWAQLLEAVAALEANPKYCKTVIFDTGYGAYDLCYQHMCEEYGVQTHQDAPFGFWKEVEREFKETQARVRDAGFGLVATAHCDEEEVTKFGMTRNVTVTQLGKQATRYYLAEMDIIGYYHFSESGERLLQIRGDSETLAGVRTEGKFLFPNGEPIKMINMGKSPKEAYNNFLSAFQNKLTTAKEAKGGTKLKLKK